MVVTLGQQYNIGEKPTVILNCCTHALIAIQGHQKNSKNKNIVSSTSSNMVDSNSILLHRLIGCEDKATTWMVITLGQQYYVGEKPTVIIMYACINRHAETPNITKHKNNSAIEPCFVE